MQILGHTDKVEATAQNFFSLLQRRKMTQLASNTSSSCVAKKVHPTSFASVSLTQNNCKYLFDSKYLRNETKYETNS
jgi:hypothetical protein